MKNIKTKRIIAAIACILAATVLLIITVSAQMCPNYGWSQFVATFILDYGFMFIVWLLIDELITNNKNKIY